MHQRKRRGRDNTCKGGGKGVEIKLRKKRSADGGERRENMCKAFLPRGIGNSFEKRCQKELKPSDSAERARRQKGNQGDGNTAGL